MNNPTPQGEANQGQIQPPPPIKYCLYARKSSESEERQVLSVDSQVKEMLQIAEREKLNIVEMRRESHSAKDTGQRPVFNELINDIRLGKFNGLLTWAPDRLSRNAGDLGVLVDLMDQKLLTEIRTHGQVFTNSPNEKFLLMILGSQAKLENDNRGINVVRGLKTRVEMGLWPGVAPLGYLNQNRQDKKCQVILDPQRAPVIKQMFERVAYQKHSGRIIYNWMRFELNFRTRGDKHMALSGIYRALTTPFYYGMFEYPMKSGSWYEGKHKPIITKELYDQVQSQLQRDHVVKQSREFAFTKLFTCGHCGSGITAEEKYKQLKDGTTNKYIYYGCTRTRDPHCKNMYIREEDLIQQLLGILDQVDINELGMRYKLEEEIKRFNKFQHVVMGTKADDVSEETEVNIRKYAKYLLKDGSIIEKRELLANLRSRLVYKDKTITLMQAT